MRSNSPFFSNSSTIQRITELASLDRMVIYAGAGVTIDRTGFSWTGLIRQLFDEVDVPADRAEKLLKAYGPDRVASILTEQFKGVYGGKWEARLRNELRRMLYLNGEWLVGRLTDTLASLLSRQALEGGAVVYTTNYDGYLDARLEKIRETFEEQKLSLFEVRKYTRTVKYHEVRHEPGVVKVVYLHGYVPDRDIQYGAFANAGAVAEAELAPVLSELEYLQAGDDYGALLQDAFATDPILVLGSSMTDPPLLRALMQRSIENNKKKKRKVAQSPSYVVLTMQDELWRGGTVEREAMQRLVSRRMEHLDITPVFADFYGQVSQFLHEVGIAHAIRHADSEQAALPSSYDDLSFGGRYNDRLASWWTLWQATQLSQQDTHSGHLLSRLGDIRRTLGVPESERLKLEVWLRWQPSDTSRRLRLWASSVGAVHDVKLMRDADIDDQSEYISVQAFCLGRPFIKADNNAATRWHTYFAVPVALSSSVPGFEEGSGEVIVAVVTLATMNNRNESCMRLDNQAALEEVKIIMENVARLIAGEDPEEEGSTDSTEQSKKEDITGFTEEPDEEDSTVPQHGE